MRNLILLCAALAVSPALPQEAATPTPPPEKKICKTLTPTGSIMGKRFCLTKAEWQQLNSINSRNAEDAMGARKLSAPKGAGEF